MTDTATGGAASIQINAEALQELFTKIGELDTQIASASGNDTAARKAFIDQITGEHADDVDKLVESIVKQLKGKPEPVLVGLVTRLNEALKSDLEPVVNTWVDIEFPKTKVDSKVDVDALKEERKSQITVFKALREVLNTFKIPTDHIPDPKRSGGGRPLGSTNSGGASKSGANKEGYRYALDGKDRPPSQNSISSLCFYSTLGVPAAINPEDPKPRKRWSTPELKAHLKTQGIEFGTQDEWTVQLANGKTISARRLTDADKSEFGIGDEVAGATETVTAPVTDAVAGVVG